MPLRVPPFVVTGALAAGGLFGSKAIFDHLEQDQTHDEAANMHLVAGLGMGVASVALLFRGIGQSARGVSATPAQSGAALLFGGALGATGASFTLPPADGQLSYEQVLQQQRERDQQFREERAERRLREPSGRRPCAASRLDA